MGSSNRIAAYFRRKAMIERARAAAIAPAAESRLRAELAQLYDLRAEDAERQRHAPAESSVNRACLYDAGE